MLRNIFESRRTKGETVYKKCKSYPTVVVIKQKRNICQILLALREVYRMSRSQMFFKIVAEASRPDVFCEKGVLRTFAKFTRKHLYQSLFFNKVAGGACIFIKKETLPQVFSCEFCEISKNTFFYRTTLVAASVGVLQKFPNIHLKVCNSIKKKGVFL